MVEVIERSTDRTDWAEDVRCQNGTCGALLKLSLPDLQIVRAPWWQRWYGEGYHSPWYTPPQEYRVYFTCPECGVRQRSRVAEHSVDVAVLHHMYQDGGQAK